MTLLTHLPCSSTAQQPQGWITVTHHSYHQLAAVAAAIMVIPSDLPTVLPGPGKQKENPTAQPKASKPTRCGAYELVRGGLPAQAD